MIEPLPIRPTISEIQEAVIDTFGVLHGDMASKSRMRRVARPRQVAMFLCHALTLRSLTQIGDRFSRDHTTVLHAIRHVSKLFEEDRELAEQVRGAVRYSAELVATRCAAEQAA